MVDIIIHSFGDGFAIGLSSKNYQEIIHQYYSLWNLKATSGRLNWLSQNKEPFFAFVWSSQTAFDKWLYDSSVRIYGNSVPKIKSISVAKKAIKTLIKDRKKKIKYENFIKFNKDDSEDFFVPGVNVSEIFIDLMREEGYKEVC